MKKDYDIRDITMSENSVNLRAYVTVRPKSLSDKIAIASYCKDYLGLSIDFATSSSSKEVTFDDFVKIISHSRKQDIKSEYFHLGNGCLPRTGEVISFEMGIGLVKEVKHDSLLLAALLKQDGSFICSDFLVSDGLFRQGTEEEKTLLQNRLNELNLRWSTGLNNIVNKHPIENNSFVRVSLLGNLIALGIFREINEKGEIVLYCKIIKGEKVKFSLYEIVGKVTDYQIQLASVNERKHIIDGLKEAGLKWNGHRRRVEPMLYKFNKQRMYYYISEYGKIIKTENNSNRKDKKRYLCGNFFQKKLFATTLQKKYYYKSFIKTEVLKKKKSYFFINDNWEIGKTKREWNLSRMQHCGNIYETREEAEKKLNEIINFRNFQLSKINI